MPGRGRSCTSVWSSENIYILWRTSNILYCRIGLFLNHLTTSRTTGDKNVFQNNTISSSSSSPSEFTSRISTFYTRSGSNKTLLCCALENLKCKVLGVYEWWIILAPRNSLFSRENHIILKNQSFEKENIESSSQQSIIVRKLYSRTLDIFAILTHTVCVSEH